LFVSPHVRSPVTSWSKTWLLKSYSWPNILPEVEKKHFAFTHSTILEPFAAAFGQVYVTSPTDTAAIINAKLGQGLHIVITPGIYQIDSPLVVRNKGQV
jgi:hypothetical protein